MDKKDHESPNEEPVSPRAVPRSAFMLARAIVGPICPESCQTCTCSNAEWLTVAMSYEDIRNNLQALSETRRSIGESFKAYIAEAAAIRRQEERDPEGAAIRYIIHEGRLDVGDQSFLRFLQSVDEYGAQLEAASGGGFAVDNCPHNRRHV